MRVNRFLAAAAAIFIAVLPAHADQILGPGRITSGTNKLVLPGGPTLGTYQNGKFTSQPDATTGDVSAASVQTAPSVQRSLLSKIGDLPVTLPDVGATCDGSSLIDQFWTALNSTTRKVVVADGNNCRVASNIVMPKGKGIEVQGAGRITVDAGKTLTIKSEFAAPRRQVFFGGGTVLGLRYNRPEWWGTNTAYGTTFDNAPAINAAIRSAEAAYSGNDPTNPSDGSRPTVDIGGGGYWNVCSPIHHYPRPAVQFTFQGSGQINGGSQIIACPTFSGGAIIQIHGIAPADTFGSWDSVFRDFSISDPSRLSSACVRYVPEGNGYTLNPGAQRASAIERVTAQGCPIGFDVVNTLQMTMRGLNYIGVGTSNNVGIRFATAGTGNTAATGEIAVYDSNIAPCPTFNNGTCSNTTNVQFQASGGNGTSNGPNVSAINFSGNNIMWAANRGFDFSATTGGYIGDVWAMAVQFDGVGCSYVKMLSDGTGGSSLITNVHLDHLYQTSVSDTSCIPHKFEALNGGKINYIWDTNNQFVLGGATNSAIYYNAVTNFTIAGNQISGGGSSRPAMDLIVSSKGTVIGNVIDALAVATQWTNGVNSNGSTKLAVTGNLCSGTTGTCVTGLDGASASTGNVGP